MTKISPEQTVNILSITSINNNELNTAANRVLHFLIEQIN